MTQMTVTLTLADPLADELRQASQELLAELLDRGLRERKIDRVLAVYARSEMSFGAAAEELDMAYDELARVAYARGLAPHWTENTIEEEMGLV